MLVLILDIEPRPVLYQVLNVCHSLMSSSPKATLVFLLSPANIPIVIVPVVCSNLFKNWLRRDIGN